MTVDREGRLSLLFAVLLSLSPALVIADEPAPAPEMFSQESLQAVALSVIADEKIINEDIETPPRPKSYKPYWTTYAWLTAATVYDVESTFYLLDRCIECQEQNPIIRPIIDRGQLATYLFSATVNGVVMYIARRMYDRADPWWRIIPITLTVVHAVAGTWNLYQASRPDE